MDAKSNVYYKYTDSKWDPIAHRNIVDIEGREKFITYIEQLRLLLSKQVHESTDEVFNSQGDVTLKRMTMLLKNLGTQGYINSLMARITGDITKVTTYQPCHRDIAGVSAPTMYNLFPGFPANKVLFDNNVYGTHIGLRRLLAHIYEVWADGNDYLYWYCISWLARPFRNFNRTI